MKTHIKIAAAALLAATMTTAANAQSGVATGAVTGAVGGALVGGPVGAGVGAIAGAVTGGIADNTRIEFRDYVVREKRPSYVYSGDIRIGTRLPDTYVYYDVPEKYGVKRYRYAVVNNHTVLVDPETKVVVQIVD